MAMHSHNKTIPVRSGESFDVGRLTDYLRQLVPGIPGEPIVTQYPSGKSNLTYRLEFPDRVWVLRRPPLGTKAKSAHDMGREYTVLQQLKSVIEVVPKVYHFCSDEQVIGSEFYLMEAVDGQVIHQNFPPEWGWGQAEVRRFCLDFWDQLIAVHGLSYEAAGLGELGRPVGYVERQISGWTRRFQRARTPDVPSCEAITAWLAANQPPDGEACILHNDYRMDNVLVSSEAPHRIAAVIDWEMAAVGHPLMDLGNSLAYWTEAGDDATALAAVSQPSAVPGMLTRAEIIDYYADRTGRDLSGIRFFLVYGYFRLAAIIQQIYFRFVNGQTEDARFANLGLEVVRLNERCERVIQSDSAV